MINKVGLIKYNVPRAKDLNHPALTYPCNMKLLISLCTTCAVDWKFLCECVHESTVQRSNFLTSTWILHEARLAIQNGYEVHDSMEVYEFEVTKYDPYTREFGLFDDYINKFLKLKAKASG